MSTCEIKPLDNERSHIRKFVEGTNLRAFEQAVFRRIQERLINNPDVDLLNENIAVVAAEVGGSSRIKELITNLPMIINAALEVKFRGINERDLSQEIEVKIDHEKVKSNLNIYISTFVYLSILLSSGSIY